MRVRSSLRLRPLAAACALAGALVAPAASARAADAAGVASVLAPVGHSAERGTIVVGPARDFGTIVHLRVRHQPPGVLQPAEIHAGTCAKFAPEARYVLSLVLNGVSDSRLDVARRELLSGGGVVIVRISRMRDDVVACGRIG